MPQYMLKDGTSTFDRRLDRIPAFDQRSLNYPVQAALNAEQQTLVSRLWTAPTGTPVLDQGAEGACFPAGTRVLLADGSYRAIEQVQVGDLVVTAEGNIGVVTHLMRRPANLGLTNVAVEGHVPFCCTPEHPVLTQRGYVRAEELLVGDVVAVPRWNAENEDPLYPAELVDVQSLYVRKATKRLPELVSRTPELGRLLGLYAAEGNTTVNKVVWNFGGHEETTLVAETIDLVKSVFGEKASVVRRRSGAVTVVLYGKAWRLLFETLIPGTSKRGDMYLSKHVTGGSAEYRKAILEGWLAGDGHFRRGSWLGVGVSRQLLLDMHTIANGLGFRPSLHQQNPSMNRYAATRQMRYELAVGFGAGSSRSARQDEYAMWRRVRSVSHEDFDGDVFNLEVEGDHSYVADGVGVHNCVGFGVTHELLYNPVPVRGLNETFAREKIYWVAQREDPWPGGSYAGATPRYEGTSVLYGIKAAADLGYYTEYRWATSEKEMALGVGHLGPAIIGVDWYEGMFKPDSDGFLHPTGEKIGGHCCLIIGVNVDKRRTKKNMLAQATDPTKTGYYTLHNSWGPSWGDKGNAKITRQDMAKLIADNGEVCIITQRTQPAKKKTAKQLVEATPLGAQ